MVAAVFLAKKPLPHELHVHMRSAIAARPQGAFA
jgi:hypothetical protein